MALPTWERERARLEAEGPKSPPPIAHLSPRSHTRRSTSTAAAAAALPTAVASAGASLSGTPPASGDSHAAAEKRGKSSRRGKHASSSRASTDEPPLPKGGGAAGGAEEGEAIETPGYAQLRAEVIDPPLVAIDSALHRAQVLALAQLRSNPNATR